MLVVAMGIAPIVPPEHVHEAEEQGHQHIVIHRHLEPHRSGDHSGQHHAVVDHDDEPLLTLAAVYTVPTSPSVDSPLAVVDALISPVTSPRAEYVRPDVDILIHGPPRGPTSLRAPPISPAS